MDRIIVSVLLTFMVTVVALPVNNLPSVNTIGSTDLLPDFQKPVYLNQQLDLTEYREPRRISEEKCDEYSHLTSYIMPLGKSKPIPITVECTAPITPLVAGGEAVRNGEFPHMAAIGWLRQSGEITYHCGGSLVSERWVLTAAHCTHHSMMGNPFVVKIGANRLSDEKSGQVFKIDRIDRHPKYVPPAMYADIALLKLAKPVTFTANIRPACIENSIDEVPNQAWVTGWGFKEMRGRRSDVLLRAKLDIVDNVQCSILHNFTTSAPSGIVPSMLCAGDPNGGWRKDSCRGDSGGPLQTVRNSCLYNVIGITSFGRFCATPDSPGIYTRVSHYLEWIEDIVWGPADRLIFE